MAQPHEDRRFLMTTQIDQPVPVRVLSRGDETNCSEREVALTAHRFGGVLKRPVPIPEMARVCGIDGRGSKVVADWPRTFDASDFVRIGDVLEIAGRTYSIRGVRAAPGVYLELYLAED
jgi:hypothetical protein